MTWRLVRSASCSAKEAHGDTVTRPRSGPWLLRSSARRKASA